MKRQLGKLKQKKILKLTVIILKRVLGSLLSAHLIIIDEKQPFGDMKIKDYSSELLHLAHDLASRLLQAFVDTSETNLPFPRVSY